MANDRTEPNHKEKYFLKKKFFFWLVKLNFITVNWRKIENFSSVILSK